MREKIGGIEEIIRLLKTATPKFEIGLCYEKKEGDEYETLFYVTLFPSGRRFFSRTLDGLFDLLLNLIEKEEKWWL